MHLTRAMAAARAGGFTMVEFMIAMTLSLLVMAALSGAFISSMRARDEVSRANEQIENGRYAVELLTDDLRLAGYYGEFDLQMANPATPAALPDPCAADLATLQAAIALHVQGYDGGTSLSCVTDARADSDMIVIRRVSTCVAGSANCTSVAGAPYFQASLCTSPTELQSSNPTAWYRLNTNLAALNRTRRNCTTLADRRRLITRIYFVANNDESGDGIPTLKRAELRAGSFETTPLAHGIETLQFEYGIDSDGNGVPEAFAADPSTHGGCGGSACVQNWRDVVTARLSVLARSTSTSPAHEDTKTYTLGRQADGSPNTVGPFNDAYKRHAFNSSIRLVNPASRRE